MIKLLFLFMFVFSFFGRAENLTTYYGSNNEIIIEPEGLTLIKNNLYQDKENNLYFLTDYIQHSSSDDDTILAKKLGTFLQKEIYEKNSDSLVPISKVIDIDSYQMLDKLIFKDKNHSYFYTGTEYSNYPFIIADELLSPDDITLLDGRYLISRNHVYHYGAYSYIVEVKNAQAATFSVFRLGLKDEEINRYIVIGKDKNRCYLDGETLDKDSIKSINEIVYPALLSDCN